MLHISSVFQIILYEDQNFEGKKLELTSGVPKLSAHEFNDIISSIKVESGVYDHSKYTFSICVICPNLSFSHNLKRSFFKL